MSVRLNETGWLLLTALAEGDNHGYALARRVDEITDGEIQPGAGALYSTLERLLTAGLIEDAGTEVVDGRARRGYRITESGRVALAHRAEKLRRRLHAMTVALGEG